MRRSLLLLIGCLLSPAVNADLADLLGGTPAVLRPEQAFAPQLVAGADGRLAVQFRIAPGHYLYRDRLQVTDARGTPLRLQLPPGELYDDPESGSVAVLRGEQTVHLDIPALTGATVGLRYQGCAQGRLCYAPVSLRLRLPEQSR
ncbi:protein-disulfide reductase DsbD N-terminal domain-containing protein [Immundisolibacter sp.]